MTISTTGKPASPNTTNWSPIKFPRTDRSSQKSFSAYAKSLPNNAVAVLHMDFLKQFLISPYYGVPRALFTEKITQHRSLHGAGQAGMARELISLSILTAAPTSDDWRAIISSLKSTIIIEDPPTHHGPYDGIEARLGCYVYRFLMETLHWVKNGPTKTPMRSDLLPSLSLLAVFI